MNQENHFQGDQRIFQTKPAQLRIGKRRAFAGKGAQQNPVAAVTIVNVDFQRLIGNAQFEIKIQFEARKGRDIKVLGCDFAIHLMFVQLILDVIWRLYQTTLDEDSSNDKLLTLLERLDSSITLKELQREKDKKRKLQLILGRWLPIPAAVLGTVVDYLPSPIAAQQQRPRCYL